MAPKVIYEKGKGEGLKELERKLISELMKNSRRSDKELAKAIFSTRLDLTHPLCFGYGREIVPVFKSTVSVAKKDPNIYNNPVVYTDDPLLSGYCTDENRDRIKGAPFASVHGTRIISLYDNTNFRAIWYGTNKIFLNAVFFGQIIR